MIFPRILPLLTVLALPLHIEAQQPEGPDAERRRVTALVGLGNAFGWFGGQAEWYLGDGRTSVFGGLGYTPEIDLGGPTGLTAAAGVRRFTGGARHRAFAELSISQIGVTTLRGPLGAVGEGERHYGPGLQVGYQFAAGGGFTLMGSSGIGYALGLDDDVDASALEVLLGLGFGYTWR